MKFKSEIEVTSPGRINLIGEHTDYNGGFVLPAAIEQTIHLSFRQNGTRICNIKSEDYKSGFSVGLDSIEKSNFHWHNYILGVIKEIQLLDSEPLKGFDCTIKSDLPIGSGISSSAALECGLAKGLNELFNIGLTNDQIIKLARNAEHNFVGTKCGIMDQFAVTMGKKNKFIKLNCKNLNHTYIGTDLGPYQLVLLNTNVSHNLVSSEYNKRREECAEVLEFINQGNSRYKYLCDVPLSVVEAIKKKVPKTLYSRALYAVEENERVHLAAKALEQDNLKILGELLYKSHEGLKNLYEVSCKELDFMVDFSKDYQEVLGSRMMGGGFGGCTISLIHKDQLEIFLKKVSQAYYRKFNIEATPIMVNIGDGVTVEGNDS